MSSSQRKFLLLVAAIFAIMAVISYQAINDKEKVDIEEIENATGDINAITDEAVQQIDEAVIESDATLREATVEIHSDVEAVSEEKAEEVVETVDDTISKIDEVIEE